MADTPFLVRWTSPIVIGCVLAWFLAASLAAASSDWIPWDPPRDDFRESAIDLRFLNESEAGAHGRVQVRDGRFVLGNGTAVRFWGVNSTPETLGGEALPQTARALAKRGVNLVRIHSAVFDRKTGQFLPEVAESMREIVQALKAEGIYTHLSIYFPLWFNPEPNLAFLEGYDGNQHPFAALFFNPDFQEKYRTWWRRLLTETHGVDEPLLLDEPAVLGLELINEDSLFFWTFNSNNLPPPQREMFERQFATWVEQRYGGFPQAFAAWNEMRLPEDAPAEGRLAFRPFFQIFTDRTPRDQDTARFLFEVQRDFYAQQVRFLRELGFAGLITASNWTTANNEILGPLEKASYLPGDFIDRHGYWAGLHEGENAAWSLREGHRFSHRSAVRFDPPKPGQPRQFTHPVFDTKINGLPSMVSETTFNRPNRYRVEAPGFYAIYGALQGSDAIVHFALDGVDWNVQPNFWMQPWTLMSPTQMGQFPAAALIYRLGLVREGELVADVHLPLSEALALKGSPLVESSNLDELRKSDVLEETTKPADTINPAIHLVGRSQLTIAEAAQETQVQDLQAFLDEATGKVLSSTGEVELNLEQGLLKLTSPSAQGVIGNVRETGPVTLPLATVVSDSDNVAVFLVPLDGQPLAESARWLLQIMTEERPTGFTTEVQEDGTEILTSLGHNPWQIQPAQVQVKFTAEEHHPYQITPLNILGYPAAEKVVGREVIWNQSSPYYLIEKHPPEVSPEVGR